MLNSEMNWILIMPKIIGLLIALLAFSHGDLNSENYLNYRRKFYNIIENETQVNNNVLGPLYARFRIPQYFQQSNSQYKCVKSGFYADAYDCRTYYECVKIENNYRGENFHQYVHKCNNDKVFSRDGMHCTQPQKSGRVECGGYPQSKEQDHTDIDQRHKENEKHKKRNRQRSESSQSNSSEDYYTKRPKPTTKKQTNKDIDSTIQTTISHHTITKKYSYNSSKEKSQSNESTEELEMMSQIFTQSQSGSDKDIKSKKKETKKDHEKDKKHKEKKNSRESNSNSEEHHTKKPKPTTKKKNNDIESTTQTITPHHTTTKKYSQSKEESQSNESIEDKMTTLQIPTENQSESKEGNQSSESENQGTTPQVPSENESGSKENSQSNESQHNQGSTPRIPPESQSESKENSQSNESRDDKVTTPQISTEGQSESKEDNQSNESYENQDTTSQIPTESQRSQEDNSEDTKNITTQVPHCPDEQAGNKNESDKSFSECISAGFFPDPHDCAKFYRCVELEPNIFNKYEFVCPPGTVWDEDKTTCNYAWAVKQLSCKSKEENISERNNKTDKNGKQTTTDFPTSTKLLTESTISTEFICPIGNLTGDQVLLTCPTGFRRHPKYCNLFYQCIITNNINGKIVVFMCPENRIFDNRKIQCVKNIRNIFSGYNNCKRFDSSTTDMSKSIRLCPGEGHFPYSKDYSNAYYKCKHDFHGILQGYLFKCPYGKMYSCNSRHCECNKYHSGYKQRDNNRKDDGQFASKGLYISHQEVFYVGPKPPYLAKN